MPYFRPPGKTPCQSVALTAWKNGLLMAGQQQPVAFNYVSSAGTLVPVPLPTVPGLTGGFVAAVQNDSGDAWLLGYSGAALKIAATGSVVTSYGLPSGVYTGAAHTQGHPYFLRSNGDVFTVVSGAVIQMSGTFGEQASDLSADAGHLYAALPGSSSLGVMAFTALVSGVVNKIATPFDTPALVAASASGVAVAGWSRANVPVSASGIAVSQNGQHAVMFNTATNLLTLLTGPDLNWTVTSTASGTGAPIDAQWASSGEQVLTADLTLSTVEVYNLVINALIPAQALMVSGVTRLGVTPDGTTALALQTAPGAVQVLTNTTNVWSLAGTVPISTAPTSIAMVSNLEAVVGLQASGSAGLQWLENNGGTWSAGVAVAGLAALPTALALDTVGTVYAIGSLSGTGYLTALSKTALLSQVTWTGSADSVVWDQDQVAVLDRTNALIRLYSATNSTLLPQGTVAANLNTIGQTGETVWLLSASSARQYRWTAPFTLAPVLSGKVSVYVSGVFSTATPGVENEPSAVTWDASGTVWAGTVDDRLYRVTAGGVIVSGLIVPPYAGQSAGALLGIAALTWYQDNHLYSASSLNGRLGLIQ